MPPNRGHKRVSSSSISSESAVDGSGKQQIIVPESTTSVAKLSQQFNGNYYIAMERHRLSIDSNLSIITSSIMMLLLLLLTYA